MSGGRRLFFYCGGSRLFFFCDATCALNKKLRALRFKKKNARRDLRQKTSELRFRATLSSEGDCIPAHCRAGTC